MELSTQLRAGTLAGISFGSYGSTIPSCYSRPASKLGHYPAFPVIAFSVSNTQVRSMSERSKQLDPYSILGVDRNASIEEITAAFRQKRDEVTYSPRLSATEIEAAYEVLKNPELRERVNRKLDTQAAVSQTTSAPAPSPEDDSPPATVSRRSSRLKSAFLIVFFGVLLVSVFFC